MDQPMARRFGLAVCRHRTQLRLTQAELASIAGMHRTYIGAVERGEKNVSLANMARLATALDVPLSQLVLEAERPQAAAR